MYTGAPDNELESADQSRVAAPTILAACASELAPQGERLDDVRLRADLEQHAQGSVLAVELQRHRLAAAKALAERLEPRAQPRTERIQQAPATARADAQLDGEVARRRIALEALAPPLPELLQIEVRVARERLTVWRERLDARDAEHAHLALHASDQVPGVDFDDQRIRVDAIIAMLVVAALVANVDAGVLPEQRAQLIQERRSVARAKPGLRIEQQPAARVLRAQLMNRRHGCRQFVERGVSRHRQFAHTHRCRTRDERERLRLVRTRVP